MAVVAAIGVLLITEGCSRPKHVTYVARVGSARLSREDMNLARAANADSVVNTRAYVNDWVTTQLLYQEAERRGLTNSDEVRRQVEEASRRLAVAALLQKEVYADSAEVSEDAVASFYRQHNASFVLPEDVANISYVAFSDHDAANRFRTKVIGGKTWDAVVNGIRQDSAARMTLLQSAEHQYFTRGRLFPQELWKLAMTLNRKDVSFVLKAYSGFYVIATHSILRQGTIAELAYVRNQIVDLLLVERRRERYEHLVMDLRAKATVDISSGVAPDATE